MPTRVMKVTTETRQKFDAKTGPVQCYQAEKEIFWRAVEKGGYESMSDFLRHAARDAAERAGFELPPESDYVTVVESAA